MENTNVNNICNLCGKSEQLKKSHLIPKFFANHIKKTSETGRFRGSHDPTIPTQDIDKFEFLCGECEQLFSKHEREFSLFFHKYKDETNKTFTATESTLYFIVSMFWRQFKYGFEKEPDTFKNEFLKHEIPIIETFFKNCEDFLNGKIHNLDQYKFHIIPISKEACEKLDLPYTWQTNERGIGRNQRMFSAIQESFNLIILSINVPFFIFMVEVIPYEKNISQHTLVKSGNLLCDLNKISFNELPGGLYFPHEFLKSNIQLFIKSKDKLSPEHLQNIEDYKNKKAGKK